MHKFLFFVFIIFSSSLIDFAFAQNDMTSQYEYNKTIDELDDLLSTQVTATLTGLSLAGAAFLVRTINGEDDEIKRHTRQAQKKFIAAFLMFLISTIFIFIFDFLEALIKDLPIYGLLLDIIITYGFFGGGIVYLVKSAREIYIMYGK